MELLAWRMIQAWLLLTLVMVCTLMDSAYMNYFTAI